MIISLLVAIVLVVRLKTKVTVVKVLREHLLQREYIRYIQAYGH